MRTRASTSDDVITPTALAVGVEIQPTTQVPAPTAEAPQLTAEAISCLYGVGCSYESPIHVHTDCFSCRGGNTELSGWIHEAGRGAHTTNAPIPTALAVGVEIWSCRGVNTKLSVWYGVEYLWGYTKKALQQETEF